MTALLSTSRGRVVAVPHFILPCRNCGAPMRATLAAVPDSRTTFRLDLVCEGGCGIEQAFVIEPKVPAKAVR